LPSRRVISTIIPTYNRRELVREAVASVLAQNDPGEECEILVVDDGSTDGTDSDLARVAPGIKYLRQDHSGVSAARNLGILQSRGDIIAFLDSDDLWLPGKLAAQLAFFRENPSAVLCQTEETWLRRGKKLNPKKYHKKPEGRCFPLLLERCLVSPSAVAMRRGLFDSVGLFDESLPACEDYDLWLRIGSRYPLGLIEKPLVIKRGGHPDQLSATIPSLDRFRIRALAKLLCTGTLEQADHDAARKVLLEKARVYAGGCRKRGKEAEAELMEDLVRGILNVDHLPDSSPLFLSEFLLK